jgi:predicted nucleotidyltransferase
MYSEVGKKLNQVIEICKRRGVRRLALFGSAATDGFIPDSSDLDFLVDLERVPPAQYAERYFGLQEDLEQLFGVAVDLVESHPIRNPYFRDAIEKTQVLLYAAA